MFPPHMVDFYKCGHIFQYPLKTEYVYSNFTHRSDDRSNNLPDFDHKIVFFGLQGICKWLLVDLWNKEFFQKSKDEVVAKYKRRMDTSLGKGAVTVDHIAALHDLGYLPVHIKALQEGSRVNIRVPVFTIVNTDPAFYWVTNYLETQLSAEVWKSVTTATKAYEFKRLFIQYALETGGDLDFVNYQGHNFADRGMSGMQDAAQSGAAHLICFLGTDSVGSIDYIEDYYGSINTVGFSVPATEHSVMTAGGEVDELETIKDLITRVYPSGVVSIVSDTWDFWNVVTNHMQVLKYVVLNRNGKVVLRPDSGDPVKIICGDPDAPVGSPVYKGAVECLWEIYGGTTNSKGYRTLDSHVGLIYGDSISLIRSHQIFEGLKAKMFASDNIVYGIGSFTYQYVTRDTYGAAMKSTYAIVDGVGRILFKDPKTDNGMKRSAKGLLKVIKEGKDYILVDQVTPEEEKTGELRTVFYNSKIYNNQTLDDVKTRLELDA